jgi:flagellar assembly protein FliH
MDCCRFSQLQENQVRKAIDLAEENTVAAPRVTHPNFKESGFADGPVLERLQYRIAQSGKNLRGASEGDPLTASMPLHSVVALFPKHADDLYEAEQAEKTPSQLQESETNGQQAVAELERCLAEEKMAALQAIAAAREQGRREERQLVEETLAAERRQFQTQILQALEEFRSERQRYFHHVEGEVVRLSLAIAGRVLHREAHLDPMLLAGAVRVALGKLADSSNVVMRVPPAEVAKWKEFFREAGSSRIQPGVLEDPSLSPGECLLVTELGTIELGVRAQLEEIEKGFFDLLDHRPVSPSANPANGTSST